MNEKEKMKCHCGGDIERKTISCPDKKEGCLVIHYGYVCNSCGVIRK